MRVGQQSFLLVAATTILGAWTADAPVETVIYSFQGGDDGGIPYAPLTWEAGAFYGAADIGGSACDSCGYIYKLTPPAPGQTSWTKTILYNFPAATEGAHPQSRLIFDKAGAIYGTTSTGGIGVGTVFKLTPPSGQQTAWTETELHSFTGKDGEFPYGPLIMDDRGALYGTAEGGGSHGGGVVFRLAPSTSGGHTWTEAVIYSFTGGSDGEAPLGGVIEDQRGTLFGTTQYGGSAGLGTVFKLVQTDDWRREWSETVLHSFTGGDGANPNAGLIMDRRGNLYGPTSQGGTGICAESSGCGTIFELSPPASAKAAWTETVLHGFTGGADGSYPNSTLALGDEGTLYGAAVNGGGSGCGGSGCGIVFKLTPPAAEPAPWAETVLNRFKGGKDGAYPSSVVFRDTRLGLLFGTAYSGGLGNCSIGPCGVAFELSGVK